MPKAHDTYTAKRDGRTYTYELTWGGEGRCLVWEAKVRLDRGLVGLPSGKLTLQGDVDRLKALRQEVERAIEHRLTYDPAI